MHNKFDQAKYVKREVRRARWIVARMVADGLSVECHVLNLSRHGANLVSDLANTLPSRFELAFSTSGDRRKCSVVWRRGRMVGVQFV
jgi:hypothetical protein